MTIPEICVLTSGLILNEFDNADKSIARYGQWSVCPHVSHIYIHTQCTKEGSFMDVGFGAKLLESELYAYELCDLAKYTKLICASVYTFIMWKLP